jgi:putative ABC transport system permease protein
MNWVAMKMLTGDRARYGVGVLGVAFSSLLITHQLAVYFGVMGRTCSLIRDSHPDGIWVMDPGVQNLDDARRLPDGALPRVRGVSGVAWAVPLFKGQALVHAGAGHYRQAILVGLDDSSLYGLPAEMVEGAAEDLRRPDAVVVDEAGCSYLWPGRAARVGEEVKVNDRRGTLVGICKASPPFLSTPVVYTRISDACRYCPGDRRRYSFVLVRPDGGADPRDVCERIAAQTGLLALTSESFAARTRGFFLHNTAIMYNFALVVGLGFVVGVAVAGQMFYLFTAHHLRHFAHLKALGIPDAGLARMVLLQAGMVWGQGYGLGVGAAALVLGLTTRGAPYLAGFVICGPAVVGSGVATLAIMIAAALASIGLVLRAEAALILGGP